jgi:hypothetical protein
MDTVAFAFIFTLLAGLLWLFVADLYFTSPVIADHDHDMDGVNDAHGGNFHPEHPAHNHNGLYLDGTNGRLLADLSNPNHRVH